MITHTSRTYLLLACLSFGWLGCRSPDKGAGKIGKIKKWGVFAGDRVQSTPAIGPNGTLYVGTADKHLYAFSPKGQLEWRFKTKGKVLSPRVLDDGSITFVTLDGFIYRVSYDGRLIWKKRGREKISGCPPALAENKLFVSAGYVLLGLHVKDGKFFRLTKKLPPITTCVAVGKGTLYFGSRHKLYAWGLDGKKRWSFNVGKSFRRPTLDTKGNLYIGTGGDGDGFLLSLSPDGKERWRYHPPKLDTSSVHALYKPTWGLFVEPYVAPDGSLIVVRLGEGIISISADGKKKNWVFPHHHKYPFTGRLTIAKNGMIYAGSTDNHFYAITNKGKLNYKFMTYGRIFFGGVLSKDQSTIYVGSEDKHFYALYAKKKK